MINEEKVLTSIKYITTIENGELFELVKGNGRSSTSIFFCHQQPQFVASHIDFSR